MKLEDKSEVIVQLKDNEIDLTKVALARSLLGDIVPAMSAAKTDKVNFAYVSTLIPGEIWDNKRLSLEEEIDVASQLGRLISACRMGISSDGIVNYYVRPRLLKILEKESLPNPGIRERIERLSVSVDQLKALPLTLCHVDLNRRNVSLFFTILSECVCGLG